MKNWKFLFLGLVTVFVLVGCGSKRENNLEDIFADTDKTFYLTYTDEIFNYENKDEVERKFKFQGIGNGQVDIAYIESEYRNNNTFNYTIESNQENVYVYTILDRGSNFLTLGRTSMGFDSFAVIRLDSEEEEYGWVPIAKNTAQIDSTLEEVKDIYNLGEEYTMWLENSK